MAYAEDVSDAVASELRRFFVETGPKGVVSAYLFGSHAEARAHRESDVDVAALLDRRIFGTSRERFEERLRLISRVGSALGGKDVDLVILNDAPPEFGARIVTTGLRVFCSDGEAENAFVRAVRLSAAALASEQRERELLRQLSHLRAIRTRVRGRESLEKDLSLANDVRFSLLRVSQSVVGIAGKLSSRQGDRYEDYTEAVRNLERDKRFPAGLVRKLERLPGFRNVVIHEYVALDLDRVIEALDELEPIEQFLEIVRTL